jgi:glycosyltransferase involved in cell wall biosynthesis
MQITSPKVSIGVITFNHEKFIIDCLNSIKNQSWQNIEIIISDDCSSDSTQKIIRNWVKNNPQLHCKVLFARTNMGIAKNLNKLLQHMNGEYLCFFAGDDLMALQKIEKQVVEMELNKKAGLCFSNMYWFQSEQKKVLYKHFDWFRLAPKEISQIISDNTLPSPTFLFRRKLFPPSGFDVNYPIMNDYKIGLFMFDKFPVCYISEPLVSYRRHSHSITAQNFFVNERLKFNKFLRKNYGSNFKRAVDKNRAICLYALVAWIYSSRSRNTKRDFMLALRLTPNFFTSIKWAARGYRLLKIILDKQN